MVDITAIIIFHGEKTFAPPAIMSFISGVNFARENGVTVETIAVIDKPDAMTLSLVKDYSDSFNEIAIVQFGDLGESRNYGRSISKGSFISFFDGDDLWGNEWMYKAFTYASSLDSATSILHPEVIFYFTADDYYRQSLDHTPRDPHGFYFIEVDSRTIDFDPNAIIFNNLWTANSFAHRSVYEKHPFIKVDRELGYGVEDWLWNAETLARGLSHIVVPDTVHCVRMKSSGSLSAQNTKESLLPPLHLFSVELNEI